jgi:phosphatidylserine decarboxylase
MRFHREGTNFIIVTTLMLITVNVIIYLIFPHITFFHILFYIACFILLLIILYFFRVPGRWQIEIENEVLSSADGVICAIEEVEETEYFNEKRIQVSVFMSVFNVHINWYPVKGKVIYYKYHPGSYFVAHKPKSSTENERTSVVIENQKNRKLLVRQVAGLVARRIICYAKEGEEIEQGSELGFIKFGSRVDIFLPLDTAILVKLGDKVRGRYTPIARLK